MARIEKTMNAVCVTGEYLNNQGEKKKEYLTIGKLFIFDNGGMSMRLDAVPLHFDGKVNFYDIKKRGA